MNIEDNQPRLRANEGRQFPVKAHIGRSTDEIRPRVSQEANAASLKRVEAGSLTFEQRQIL